MRHASKSAYKAIGYGSNKSYKPLRYSSRKQIRTNTTKYLQANISHHSKRQRTSWENSNTIPRHQHFRKKCASTLQNNLQARKSQTTSLNCSRNAFPVAENTINVEKALFLSLVWDRKLTLGAPSRDPPSQRIVVRTLCAVTLRYVTLSITYSIYM